MEIIYAHERPADLSGPSIFLAGPSPRGSEDHNWRPWALDRLSLMGFAGTVYVPLPRDGKWLENYDAQVDWELDHLEAARVIVFWVPRDLVHLPGFTTNVEFGLFAQSGKCVFGYPKVAVKVRYLHRVAERFNIPIFNDLDATLRCAIGKCV